MQQEYTHTLSEFTSEATLHIERLKRSGEPEILIVDGKPEIVVQNATAYQTLLNRLDTLEAISAVKGSMAEYGRGEGVPVDEGMASLREKHDIPSNR